jgi:hypothetical protein
MTVAILAVGALDLTQSSPEPFKPHPRFAIATRAAPAACNMVAAAAAGWGGTARSLGPPAA